jgi:hypothetical protein
MRVATVVLAVGLALAAAQIARADGPVITESVTTPPPTLAPSLSATCGFNVLESITIYIRALSFSDADGNLTRRISHVSVEGFYIKESTGEALPNRAVWTQVRDVEAGTLTITGLRESVQRAGGPPSAVMVGRLVLPASGGLVPIEQTPRIDFFDWWADVCTSFSE